MLEALDGPSPGSRLIEIVERKGLGVVLPRALRIDPPRQRRRLKNSATVPLQAAVGLFTFIKDAGA